MKSNKQLFTLSRLAAAVLAACMAPTLSFAQEESAEALTRPISTIEVGIGAASQSSAKFGEYNGLNKADGGIVGNANIRGGDAYGMGTGTQRWEIKASDLGTTSREVGANYSDQGQWNIGVNYDELRHNLSDSYQTPYVGAAGSNNFTLPGFGLAPNTTTLTDAQRAAYHNLDIDTTRKNTSLTAGMEITSRLGLKFDYNHLDQTGSKLMAFGSAGFAPTGVTASSGEAVSILPNPTNYQTDTVNMAVNWTGDSANLTASYFGSFFRDGYDRVNFTTFATANNSQIMSTAPGNDFHQLSVSGGYVLTPTTKLTGSLSSARNTQNDAFVVDSFMYVNTGTAAGNSKTSLDGIVVTQHADIKVTDQTTHDLVLSAGYKYDLRDNQTASSIYNFQAIGANNIAYYPNTPLSFKKNQGELAGDYRIDKTQRVRLAYNREDVSRWCNQFAVGGSNYPAGTNCVVAVSSNDDKLSATYRAKATEDLAANVGYSYSKRVTVSDPNAIVSMISIRGGDTPTTAGTIKGLNGGDYLGFYPFFDASRTQQMTKAGFSWQANERLTVGVSARYTDDRYDSTYGVQSGAGRGLNLDATYNYSDNSFVSAYATQQSNERDLTDAQRVSITQTQTTSQQLTSIIVPMGATWSNRLKTEDLTVGISSKKGGLMGGKLEMVGDLSYSLGKTNYATVLNYSTATTGGVVCSDARILSCGNLPEVKAELISFKLTGNYQMDKSSKVALGYLFQKLTSEDYYYNGLLYGSNPSSMLATNQTAPNYSVNVVTVSYIYNF
jgi:MtrB/PioB family decaheme-associated outer membrane protein